MCGIAGVLYADSCRSVSPSLLTDMGHAIAHRGPDGEGTFRSGPVGLVHRRLAIIDLEGGRQPLSNEDESIHVVFNGEIYNYRELRRQLETRGHVFRTNSDTEVLVHLYEEHGPELCTQLTRHVCVCDLGRSSPRIAAGSRSSGPEATLHLSRQRKAGLRFRTESRPRTSRTSIDPSIRPPLKIISRSASSPDNAASLAASPNFPLRIWLRISLTEFQTSPKRYWQLSFDHEDRSSVDDWKQRIDAALRESVKAHLVADVPVGAFLSGGLDSSAIVALMAELRSDPVRTFSIGFNEDRIQRAAVRPRSCTALRMSSHRRNRHS